MQKKHLYIIGGFAIVAIAGLSGNRAGAFLIVLIVLGMLLSFNKSGEIFK